MNVLDLFSGVGGFSLGFERAGFQTVAFCEANPYCQAVLRKHWPDVPIFGDIHHLGVVADTLCDRKREPQGLEQGRGRRSEDRSQPIVPRVAIDAGTIDVICGGFPCQPWSVAGQQRGAEDDRDLWHEMLRIIAEVRPRWVVGENVPGLDDVDGMGLERVLSDLEDEGYATQPGEIPACAIGANHRRNRLWIIAHADDPLWQRSERAARRRDHVPPSRQAEFEYDGAARAVADAEGRPARAGLRSGAAGNNDGRRRSGNGGGADAVRDPDGRDSAGTRAAGQQGQARSPARCGEDDPDAGRRGLSQRDGIPTWREGADPAAPASEWWAVEPDVGRVAHGIPSRVDRLRALGNAAVSQNVEQIALAIKEAERE